MDMTKLIEFRCCMRCKVKVELAAEPCETVDRKFNGAALTPFTLGLGYHPSCVHKAM